MRQREIIWHGWCVSWPDVDGGRHNVTDSDRGMVELEAEELREAGVADVRVSRVTRYRLAPLVEVSGWRTDDEGATAGTVRPGGPYAVVERYDALVPTWDAKACAGNVRMESHGHRTRKAAMVAAEAHLAVLGFRVAR